MDKGKEGRRENSEGGREGEKMPAKRKKKKVSKRY